MKISESEDTITAYLTGDIDHHSARNIREDIDAFIQMKKPYLLRLDFSGVSFMDSSGIGLIMGRYRLMSSAILESSSTIRILCLAAAMIAFSF